MPTWLDFVVYAIWASTPLLMFVAIVSINRKINAIKRGVDKFLSDEADDLDAAYAEIESLTATLAVKDTTIAALESRLAEFDAIADHMADPDGTDCDCACPSCHDSGCEECTPGYVQSQAMPFVPADAACDCDCPVCGDDEDCDCEDDDSADADELDDLEIDDLDDEDLIETGMTRGEFKAWLAQNPDLLFLADAISPESTVSVDTDRLTPKAK